MYAKYAALEPAAMNAAGASWRGVQGECHLVCL